MGLSWLWVATLVVAAALVTGQRGPSLRGALEALQRRQRGQPNNDDYELYDAFPPQVYADPDYMAGIEDDGGPLPEFVIKVLDDNVHPPDYYRYEIEKKSPDDNINTNNKESAFRERSHHSDNEKLRQLFGEDEKQKKENLANHAVDGDEEYALLLEQLWSKYRNNKHHNEANSAQGKVKLYKEKIIKKRYPDNWGPIAFKRKRSSGPENDPTNSRDVEDGKKTDDFGMPLNSNYNTYETSDDDKGDFREEYVIAFQPLDDDSVIGPNGDQYSYDSLDKSFQISKRSSGPYAKTNKRSTKEIENSTKYKKFKSSSGTDPKIIKDLSKIFGDPGEMFKTPVKRNTDKGSGNPYESYHPPQVTIAQNESHLNTEHVHLDAEYENYGNHQHHPGMAAQPENMHEKPIIVKKKAIDWTDYFGIDKRKKKSVPYVNDNTQGKLRQQYLDTFSREVVNPEDKVKVKRNYVAPNPLPETKNDDMSNLGRNTKSDNDHNSKIENIDRRLRNMEGSMVDEALALSEMGDQLDSKEEQEIKEKMLSRLAAAYSLEKMRKALKEFKQSLQQPKRSDTTSLSTIPTDQTKTKRVSVKKEKVEIPLNIPSNQDDKDFEEEQGAGHYLDGKIGDDFLDKDVGGSGRHRIPVYRTEGTSGSCPVLTKVVQRCEGVDILAGDRGQLFLPLCSLHQICYLCGEAPPTTCDLVFLSEADTACEGDMSCQRAARSALMTLRELHDNLADELDGECEASPCLPATLKLNANWQRALQR